MATKVNRAWYIDKLGVIGIVEKATNATTKDGYTSNWQSVGVVKDIRMYAISQDVDLSINLLSESWLGIPAQFHETLVYKAIANGYKDPRNMKIDAAQYFDGEYEKGLREAKKFSKSNYQTTGNLKPYEF